MLNYSPRQTSLFNLGLDLQAAQEMQHQIMNARYASNTVLNYASAWRNFESWCRSAGNRCAAPSTPNDCIEHAAWCFAEGYRVETVLLRLRAINHHHRELGFEEPAADKSVRLFLRNARRKLCERPQGLTALTPSQLRRISRAMLNRGHYTDVRDRAMILLCFSCGWRRSEIVSLDLQDVHKTEKGLTLWLGKSKTDQEGKGRAVGIFHGRWKLTCPIIALEEWLAVRGRWPGPLFTGLTRAGELGRKRVDDEALWRAVKRGMTMIGENPGGFGAHSLRAGMITACAEAGATETSIMQRTGHRSYDTLRRYVRPAQAFRSNPLAGVL